MRSTKLKNPQNRELIIPNTVLIEKQVTNLTLSDNLVQLFITIEVDRTEAIDRAVEQILRIVSEHPKILTEPPPFVLLKQADTDYLVLEVRFTLDFAEPIECLQIQSGVLVRISKLFPPSQPDGEQPAAEESSSSGLAQDAKKLDRTQIEREMKRLQGLLRVAK